MKKIVNGKEILVGPAEQAEIEDKWAAEDATKAAYGATSKYKDDRLKEYPDIGDQLDAILKALNYMQMSGQTDLVADLDSIIGKWLAVKAKYPKPGV